jgi:hypothetical protein
MNSTQEIQTNRYLKHAITVIRGGISEEQGLLRYLNNCSGKAPDQISQPVTDLLLADRKIRDLIDAVKLSVELFDAIPAGATRHAHDNNEILTALIQARMGAKIPPDATLN